jgi:aminoglycoside phosphotransferase (APT) family kinase protein
VVAAAAKASRAAAKGDIPSAPRSSDLDIGDRRWLAEVTGAAPRHTEPLSGGVTSLMLAVDDRLVLRRINREPWLTHAAELIGREAETLTLLADTPVPAPRLIAHAAPRLLMARLPGRVRLADPPLAALAQTLVTIHRVDARPRPYESWVTATEPPEWGDHALWAWALDAVSGPAPEHDPCFLHRDYHAGNVLFDGGEVVGVVDWVETSYGPADLDVARCCTNLALRTGLDAVDAFRAEYVRAGGTLSGELYWALLDVVGMVDAPTMTPAWRPRLEAYARSLRASASRSW